MSPGQLKAIPAAIRAKMGGKTNVMSLIQIPEGRKYWQRNSTDIGLTFDTTDGSPNMKQLKTYAAERGLKPPYNGSVGKEATAFLDKDDWLAEADRADGMRKTKTGQERWYRDGKRIPDPPKGPAVGPAKGPATEPKGGPPPADRRTRMQKFRAKNAAFFDDVDPEPRSLSAKKEEDVRKLKAGSADGGKIDEIFLGTNGDGRRLYYELRAGGMPVRDAAIKAGGWDGSRYEIGRNNAFVPTFRWGGEELANDHRDLEMKKYDEPHRMKIPRSQFDAMTTAEKWKYKNAAIFDSVDPDYELTPEQQKIAERVEKNTITADDLAMALDSDSDGGLKFFRELRAGGMPVRDALVKAGAWDGASYNYDPSSNSYTMSKDSNGVWTVDGYLADDASMTRGDIEEVMSVFGKTKPKVSDPREPFAYTAKVGGWDFKYYNRSGTQAEELTVVANDSRNWSHQRVFKDIRGLAQFVRDLKHPPKVKKPVEAPGGRGLFDGESQNFSGWLHGSGYCGTVVRADGTVETVRENFTGMIIDTLQRKRWYKDGKQVKYSSLSVADRNGLKVKVERPVQPARPVGPPLPPIPTFSEQESKEIEAIRKAIGHDRPWGIKDAAKKSSICNRGSTRTTF